MDKIGYKQWLANNYADKSRRYRNDLLSRAGRVEKAFQAFDNNFSLDDEFKKDGGKSLKKKLSCEGKSLIGTGITLPIGTNQMSAICGSVNTYFKYLSEIEGK